MSGRLFPKWITDTLADDLEARCDRIERRHGEGAAVEGREIVADLRAAGEGDDTWTHSWWCSGDMSDCRFNGCKPPNSGVGGTQ